MHASDATAQTPILWPLLAGLLIVLANAFFVTVEFAVVSVRRGHVERLAKQDNRSAQLVLRMLRDPDWAIAGSQVGVTLASILLGIVAEEPLKQILAPALGRILAVTPLLAGLAAALSTLLVLLLLAFVHMVLGEQAPKTIALRFPVQSALLIAQPMTIFARLASPLVWLVDRSTALVLGILGVGGQTASHGVHTVEELKDVVRESQQEGVIAFGDEKMLFRAMKFSQRFVREAMIPRTGITAVEMHATLGELVNTFKMFRHARFPVYEGDLDHICGIITMKDVLPLLADAPELLDRPLAELGVVKPAFVVPESRRVGDLFQEMRQNRTHMAIVLDEFGGTAGLVTSEELAEEVVGRLIDEWVHEPAPVSAVEGGAFEIDAQSRVDEVNETLGFDLPTSPDYETVAGFLLFLIRRIPRVGEQVLYRELRFTVLKVTGPRIERLRVERV